jgi:hypothetical protein
LLKECLGDVLNEGPKVFCMAKHNDNPRISYFLRNIDQSKVNAFPAGAQQKISIVQALRATSSAPPYFGR